MDCEEELRKVREIENHIKDSYDEKEDDVSALGMMEVLRLMMERARHMQNVEVLEILQPF